MMERKNDLLPCEEGQPERKILFVCTGNTCRSPMAEAICNQLIRERGLAERVEAVSAGVYPVPGDPPTAGAVHAMKNLYGLDLRSHAARLLDDAQLRDAWVVLAMTRRHVESIQDAFPDLGERVHTLRDYAGDDVRNPDISDPYGNSDESYEDCAREIHDVLERAAERLFRGL